MDITKTTFSNLFGEKSLRQQKGDMMMNLLSMPKECELLAITYSSDSIFESKTATLKPSARTEMTRMADMFNLFPDKVIHVEMSLDTNRFMANNHLHQKRVQTIKDALVKQEIDASLIRTITHRSVSALDSEDTISVKVIDNLVAPFKLANPSWQQGDQSYCQAC